MHAKRDDRKSGGANLSLTTWVLMVCVLGLAVIGYFNGEHVARILSNVKTHVWSSNDVGRSSEDLQGELKAILQATDRGNREAYEIAVNDLSRIDAAFNRADEGIEPTLDELVSFKGCAILCYHMAKDKFSGSCEAEERIQSVMEKHFGTYIRGANQDLENVLARLDDTLARNTTDMGVRLAALGEAVLNSEDMSAQSALRNFVDQLSAASAGFGGIAMGTIFSGTGLTLSLVFLIKKALGQITRILGPIASRLGATTAFAIGSAAADGPLPIGDIIGLVAEVGGTTWCAYDLYKAQVILRDNLECTLRSTLAQYRRELLELGQQRAVTLLKGYTDQNLRTVNDLTKQLS